jgi:hypothetical protein
MTLPPAITQSRGGAGWVSGHPTIFSFKTNNIKIITAALMPCAGGYRRNVLLLMIFFNKGFFVDLKEQLKVPQSALRFNDLFKICKLN